MAPSSRHAASCTGTASSGSCGASAIRTARQSSGAGPTPGVRVAPSGHHSSENVSHPSTAISEPSAGSWDGAVARSTRSCRYAPSPTRRTGPRSRRPSSSTANANSPVRGSSPGSEAASVGSAVMKIGAPRPPTVPTSADPGVAPSSTARAIETSATTTSRATEPAARIRTSASSSVSLKARPRLPVGGSPGTDRFPSSEALHAVWIPWSVPALPKAIKSPSKATGDPVSSSSTTRPACS